MESQKKIQTEEVPDKQNQQKSPPSCISCTYSHQHCVVHPGHRACTNCIKKKHACNFEGQDPRVEGNPSPTPSATTRCTICITRHRKCVVLAGQTSCSNCIKSMQDCSFNPTDVPIAGTRCDGCIRQHRKCMTDPGKSSCTNCARFNRPCVRSRDKQNKNMGKNQKKSMSSSPGELNIDGFRFPGPPPYASAPLKKDFTAAPLPAPKLIADVVREEEEAAKAAEAATQLSRKSTFVPALPAPERVTAKAWSTDLSLSTVMTLSQFTTDLKWQKFRLRRSLSPSRESTNLRRTTCLLPFLNWSMSRP